VTYHDASGHQEGGGDQDGKAGDHNPLLAKSKLNKFWKDALFYIEIVIFRYDSSQKGKDQRPE
jgi:hypothetical protein